MLEATCFTPKADHVSGKYRHTQGRNRKTAAKPIDKPICARRQRYQDSQPPF
jgi:hypothetical protein